MMSPTPCSGSHSNTKYWSLTCIWLIVLLSTSVSHLAIRPRLSFLYIYYTLLEATVDNSADTFILLKENNRAIQGLPIDIAVKVQISKPLCMLFNKSLHQNIFPTDWKLAHVIPLFKAGDKSFPSNYRPVSLLFSVSKIFEKNCF